MMLQSSELKLPLHPSRKRYFYFLLPRFKKRVQTPVLRHFQIHMTLILRLV